MTAGDFGGLVRRRRERLGLSQGRVAELIGRSSSTVRAWEKGRQVPVDPVVISLLAAVLDVDEADLLRSAGVEQPDEEQTLTIEQALSSIAPDGTPGGSPPATGAPTAPTSVEGDDAEGSPDGEAQVPADRPAAEAGAPPGDPAPDPTPGRQADGRPEAPGLPAEPEPEADPPPRPVWEGRDDGRRQAPTSGPVVRTMPPPTPEPTGSYLEDPEQRMAYRLRTIYTLVALAVAFIVAVWALGNAFEALGEVWDELTGML